MKKVLTVLVAIFAVFTANAQVAVVGGITSASQKIKNVDVRNTSRYHAGLAYRHRLGLGFMFQPEILYNVKDMQVADFRESATKAAYLELGAQMQWGFKLAVVRPYVLAEPYLGYALSASVGDRKLNDWTDINRREAGVAFGFGVELIDHVQVSAKYFHNMEKRVNGETDASGIAVSAAILF